MMFRSIRASMTSVPVYNAVAEVLWLEQASPLRPTLAPSPSPHLNVICTTTTMRVIRGPSVGTASYPSIEKQMPRARPQLLPNSPSFIGHELAKTFSFFHHLIPHPPHLHYHHHRPQVTQFFLHQRPRQPRHLKHLLIQHHHHFSAIHSKIIVFLMNQYPR
jgi:hypothetical protein